MHDSDSTALNPRYGTMMIGGVSVIACIISTKFVTLFGRRTIIMYGHLAMAASHLSIGILHNMKMDKEVLPMILFFKLLYDNTSGPIAWLYVVETVIDTAFGVSIFVLWFTIFVLSLVTPIIMSSDSLGVSNVFFLYSAFCFGGFLYGVFFIKETKGLTDI